MRIDLERVDSAGVDFVVPIRRCTPGPYGVVIDRSMSLYTRRAHYINIAH